MPFFGARVTRVWVEENYQLTLEEILKAAAKAEERGATFDADTIKFLQGQAAEVLKFVTRD